MSIRLFSSEERDSDPNLITARFSLALSATPVDHARINMSLMLQFGETIPLHNALVPLVFFFCLLMGHHHPLLIGAYKHRTKYEAENVYDERNHIRRKRSRKATAS